MPVNTTAGQIIAKTAKPAIVAPTVEYKGLLGTAKTLIKSEGPLSLYNGLSAGLQRQICFSSIRLGCYDSVKNFYINLFNQDKNSLSVGTRTLAALTTGALAVALAQPTDLVKIKFQGGQGKKDFSTTAGAYRAIYRTDGMRALWKGAVPNMVRNSLCNASEIVTYDLAKHLLLLHTKFQDNIYCHITAGCVAGFVATVIASPVDVVKTRYMNDSKGIYSNAIQCAYKMGKEEGLSAFYKGFLPSFIRIFSFNVVLWVVYEQVQRLMFNKKPTKSI